MKSTCARDKKLRELNLRPQMLKSWTVLYVVYSQNPLSRLFLRPAVAL